MDLPFAGMTYVITGATRGIGLEIAKWLAARGANIVVIGHTDKPDGRLEGTIHTAKEEIESFGGGKALAVLCDVRHEDEVEAAMAAASRFAIECGNESGSIEGLINNASAIVLKSIEEISPKEVRLMTSVNYFGTFFCCKYALPYLKAAAAAKRNAHILTLSPPLDIDEHWFGEEFFPYLISKLNMSTVTKCNARRLAKIGIAANSLWPRTIIDTAAIRMLEKVTNQPLVKHSRQIAIVVDAAGWILTQPAQTCTGNFFIDEHVVRTMLGVTETELSKYATCPGERLRPDLFVD